MNKRSLERTLDFKKETIKNLEDLVGGAFPPPNTGTCVSCCRASCVPPTATEP